MIVGHAVEGLHGPFKTDQVLLNSFREVVEPLWTQARGSEAWENQGAFWHINEKYKWNATLAGVSHADLFLSLKNIMDQKLTDTDVYQMGSNSERIQRFERPVYVNSVRAMWMSGPSDEKLKGSLHKDRKYSGPAAYLPMCSRWEYLPSS